MVDLSTVSSGVILPYLNRITCRKNQSATFSLLYLLYAIHSWQVTDSGKKQNTAKMVLYHAP